MANTANRPRPRIHRAGVDTSLLNPHQTTATYTAISARKYRMSVNLIDVVTKSPLELEA